MKYTFTIILKKNNADSIADFLVIPALKIFQKLDDEDQAEIKKIGLKTFLENAVTNILKLMEKRNKRINTPGLIDSVLEKVVEQNPIVLGIHDIIIHIEIDYHRNHCHFLARTLPPLYKLTLFVEISAITILSIGALQYTEGSIFSSDPKTNKGILITQSVLSSVLQLLANLASGAVVFMSNIGDEADYALSRVCSRANNIPNDLEFDPEENIVLPNRWSIRALKTFLIILVLNNIFTDATNDYVQLRAFNEKISAQPDSVIPSWLNSLAAYIAFGFNQLNDPIEVISLLVMGFKYIDSFFNEMQPSLNISSVEIEEEKRGDIKDDNKEETRRSLMGRTEYPLTQAGFARLFSSEERLNPQVTQQAPAESPAP